MWYFLLFIVAVINWGEIENFSFFERCMAVSCILIIVALVRVFKGMESIDRRLGKIEDQTYKIEDEMVKNKPDDFF
jgi:hypothetical protein